MMESNKHNICEQTPVIDSGQRVTMRELAIAYRRGLECDAVYMTTIAKLSGKTPLCRPRTSARCHASMITGLFWLTIDYAVTYVCAVASLIAALANWSRPLPSEGGIFVFSQQRFQRFSGFIETMVDPVLFSLNVLRIVRNRSFRGTFLERIPAWRVPALAARAALLQAYFWVAFARRPNWRTITYALPCWGKAVEFLLLKEIVESVPAGQPVWCTSILDRTISWLSELRLLRPYFLGVVQHGAFEGSRLPFPVEVDELVCYPWSEAFYRRFIGTPVTVRTELDLLRSQTTFSSLAEDRPGIIGVGFSSQQLLTSRSIVILRALAEHICTMTDLDTSSIRIIIYPHPLEDERLFSELAGKFPGLIELHPKGRHRDLALAVSQYSTLAMEYGRLEVPTVVLPPAQFEVDFFDLPGITVVRDHHELLAVFDEVIRNTILVRNTCFTDSTLNALEESTDPRTPSELSTSSIERS